MNAGGPVIVVTGANGQLGRLVAHALAERTPPAEVRLGSRDPGKIGDLAAIGFNTVAADFDRPETLEGAFAGAATILLISGTAPVAARIRQQRAAVDAAKAAGVSRIVYSGFTNPAAQSLFPYAAIHADTEAYIVASGLDWTFLRNGQFAENLEAAIAAARNTSRLALPGAAGKVAHIARADVAAATAAVLTGEGHAGKAYELAGPEALNLFDVSAILSESWGRAVVAAEMDFAAYGSLLAARGLPAFLVEAQLGLRRASAAGEYAAASKDAAWLAGRPIEPFSAYLRRAPA